MLGASPVVDCGRWPAKAFAGEVVPFEVTAFREGHDAIGVRLVLTDPDGESRVLPLAEAAPGTDRWRVLAQPDRAGSWSFRFEGYGDEFATWAHNAATKIDAGVDVELMYAMGRELLTAAASDRSRPAAERRYLTACATELARPDADRRALVDDARLAQIAAERPMFTLHAETETMPLRVERSRAGVGSWYEFFPRSEGAKKRRDGSWSSGTFRTAAKRLPAVAAMGFDVVYLPPIHPIGRAFRKGPNNTLDAGPNDPGSPWAIGSAEGGHDSIHPDLGTKKDFAAFLARARSLGLEIALDLALQASPDHPWVTEHPEWFTTLPDGTIAYAENPPKKYQDIYPVNFDNDPDGIRAEVLRIVRHWISFGVRIFRVDNPHTKPVAFWEWLIAEVTATDPDVVFLAEAFTRPAMMRTLAKVGFQQSYSYFTWRNTKQELEEFLTSISAETADYLRPNLFVNTPDILTEYLQFGGPAAYTIRAAIAATAAPLWGVYSGFELFENVARPGSEENIDNEKYEYKPRDFAAAEAEDRSLALLLGILNGIRRSHPALGQLRNLVLHHSEDDAILVYSKHLAGEFTTTGRPDTVIVVANVDPHSVRETTIHLDAAALGLAPGAAFHVRELITGAEWTWTEHQYVKLDAFTTPVHILEIVEAPDDV
ncbi:alpha-1,4-glucan--maltose-1-phosphate maltosyltransferase [Paramicrobacterium humi]|uniref:alpha-1,4-glucan--maltose-1-phosphate maltosyltransferase n=1 Tax=Paramicrobacterium humi TaxID=640635 RepID=UPI001FE20EA2|nr:alpha-1,4-glucan--maltose-1-phosphate maltosyltransferase [Microbacterium humi]